MRAIFVRNAAPSLITGFARPRNRVEAPHFTARLGIVRGDVCDLRSAAGRCRATADYFSCDHDRSGRVRDAGSAPVSVVSQTSAPVLASSAITCASRVRWKILSP